MAKIEFKSSEVSLLQKLYDFTIKPPVLDKDRTSGFVAWASLAAGIVAYEVYAIRSKKIETLTRAFWRITDKKIHGSIFTGAWLGLTFHLLIEKSFRRFISGKKDAI